MSYCRWSSMGGQCDLYVYESRDGIEIHVSTRRWVRKDDEPCEVENWCLEPAEAAEKVAELRGMGYRIPEGLEQDILADADLA